MRDAENHPIIMCTLTPTQVFDNEPLIKDMRNAGMRAVRINTAHLEDVDQLEAMASKLKHISRDIMILIDTKGPEVRTTSLSDDVDIQLDEGMDITLIGSDSDKPSSAKTIYVNYPNIHTEVCAGAEILIDDGHIRLRVLTVEGSQIRARIVTPGTLGAKKGLAVVGVDLDLPAVSRHDRMFIDYAAKSDLIDVLAHSFVRTASDVIKVREAMGDSKKPIIAKIENQQGIDHLKSIIDVSDGILIARGDLTASIGRDAIPVAQQEIASATKKASLPLYLATNILPSLMCGTEVSEKDIEGVTAAVLQGIDVMLLTNETASGPNPLLSVETLYRLISCAAY